MGESPFLGALAEGVRRGISANQRLCLVCEAQNSILEDFGDSAPEIDAIFEEVAAVSAQIADVSAQIDSTRATLERLHGRTPKRAPSRGGRVLQLFIANTQQAIGNVVGAALAGGADRVGIDSLLEIESRIAALILSLKKEGMFPESPDDASARTAAMEEHNERLARFLQLC